MVGLLQLGYVSLHFCMPVGFTSKSSLLRWHYVTCLFSYLPPRLSAIRSYRSMVRCICMSTQHLTIPASGSRCIQWHAFYSHLFQPALVWDTQLLHCTIRFYQCTHRSHKSVYRSLCEGDRVGRAHRHSIVWYNCLHRDIDSVTSR